MGQITGPYLRLPLAKTKININMNVTGFHMVSHRGFIIIINTVAVLGNHYAGLWEFPGGKVEPGETPEAALIRELDEELAVNTKESCLAPLTFASHEYDDFHLLLLLYVCRRWHGTPTPKENNPMIWVRPPRLGDYPMPPADKPLVAMLQDLL